MANAAGLDAFKSNQETEVIDASKKVKVAIIGTGWIAESHIASYKKMADVEIVALAGSCSRQGGSICKEI